MLMSVVYFILAILIIAWAISMLAEGLAPGTKVRRYKIVNGRRVRDYKAEAELKRRTRI
jgi:hypothetical protein